MVKLGGRDISVDQGINIIFGAGAVVDGALSMLSPGKVQNQIVGGVVPNSNSMSRLYGPGIMAMGAHSLISGLEQGGSRNKQTLQVNAAQLGLVSIACFNEWRNGGDVRNDRVKAFAIGSGVLAVGLAVRASQAGSGGTVSTI